MYYLVITSPSGYVSGQRSSWRDEFQLDLLLGRYGYQQEKRAYPKKIVEQLPLF